MGNGGTNASNAFGWQNGAPVGGSKPAGEKPLPVLRAAAGNGSYPLPPGTLPIHGPVGPPVAVPEIHVHIDNGPGTAKGDAERNAASAGSKPPATKTPTHSGGPPPPGADQQLWDAMHQSYDDQINSINQMHDQSLAHIDQLAASGNASAILYEQQLQARDAGLGAFAHANAAGINAGINGAYAGATAADRGFQGQLEHDLRSRGVGGSDVAGAHEELGAALAALRGNGTLYKSDSLAQQGLLQQMLNDREAEGATLKQGAQNDIVIAGNNAKYAADQQQTQDQAKARSAYDQGLISLKELQVRNQAAIQAAQIRASAKGSKIPPYSVYANATGTPDYRGSFSDVFNHTPSSNTTQTALAGPIFSSIQNGTVQPIDALRVWLSKPQQVRDANPGIESALREAIAQQQSVNRRNKTATRYGATYYGS